MIYIRGERFPKRLVGRRAGGLRFIRMLSPMSCGTRLLLLKKGVHARNRERQNEKKKSFWVFSILRVDLNAGTDPAFSKIVQMPNTETCYSGRFDFVCMENENLGGTFGALVFDHRL